MEKTIEGGKLLLQMWREGNYMKHRAKRLAKIRAKKEAVREDFIRGKVGSLSSMAKSLKPFKTTEFRQSSYSDRDVLKDEIKASLAQGFQVTVRNDYISVLCLRTRSSEVRFITDHVETRTKLSMIKQMKDNLVRQGALLRRPLPIGGITSHYNDVSGGVFGVIGAVGGLVTAACNSLIRGSNGRKKS